MSATTNTQSTIKPLGSLIANMVCPDCGGALYHSLSAHSVTCRCQWQIALNPQEHAELCFFSAWHGAIEHPQAWLQAIYHRQHVAVVILHNADGKNIAPPVEVETAWARLIRLGEQARDANSVQVQPIRYNPVTERALFRVSSQRRGGGSYLIETGPAGAFCPCQAHGACAHIGALYLWLLAEANKSAPVIGQGAWVADRDPAAVQARADEAMRDLFGGN